MIMIHWGILVLLITVVPFLLGMVPVSYMEKSMKTPAMVYLCGWCFDFALFELVAIPFILLKLKFSVLVVAYSIVLAMVLVIACIKYGASGLDILKNAYFIQLFSKKAKSKWVCLAWLAFLGVMLFQMYMAVFYEYYDGDDSYYLAVGTLADAYDSMYVRDSYTGFAYDLDIRHALAPMPIFQAWLAKISGIHVTIIAHSVLSVCWLFLTYCAYGQLAKVIFVREREPYRALFMLFYACWLTFGNVSINTAETFTMTRTWQGKGVLAATLIPVLFLCFLCFYQKKVSSGIWVLYVSTVLACLLASTASLMLVPTLSGLAAIVISIHKKSLRELGKMMLCCIPCVIVAVLYFVLR